MLSTTDHSHDRGQILVLFAMSITVLLIVAALAFDVGLMLVERRDQQNAADAAALAGARYILSDPARAAAEAYATAAKNGYTDGPSTNVTVYIPPEHGQYRRWAPGYIEVQIGASRPSVFGGIIGQAAWPVGAFAVAANNQGMTFSFGMLALNETACKAIHVSGDGLVYARANIQSNSSGSDCPEPPYGLSRTGGGTITIDAEDAVCRTVGAIQDQGNGDMNCDPVDYSFALPDPLEDLPAVPKPPLADPIARVGHTYDIPDYCPGSTQANRAPSESNPRPCVIGLGQAADKAWILSPGLYPGGLDVKGNSTIYLLKGIYWIGGGGFTVSGDSDIYSVASAEDLAPDAGGVLIYNSQLPNAAAGPVSLGGGGANVNLWPLNPESGSPNAIYKDIVLFQDRAVTTTVTLNGSAAVAKVLGIIYVPEGEVKLNGNGGTLTVDQVIADTFLADGNGGTIRVMRDRGVDVIISGVGLVE